MLALLLLRAAPVAHPGDDGGGIGSGVGDESLQIIHAGQLLARRRPRDSPHALHDAREMVPRERNGAAREKRCRAFALQLYMKGLCVARDVYILS